MATLEFNRTFQRFQSLNWRSTSEDRKIVLDKIHEISRNLAQLSFKERSTCYSILKVVEQHEYKHLFIWVRVFEWIRSKFNANFCTTSQLLSKVRIERKNFETLYLSHRQLVADDLKELQTLNDKSSVRSHLSTFGQCLVTPAEKALHTAIKIGRLADVKKLCGKYTPQKILNQEFRPENPLQIALKTKNKEVIDFLLQSGAKISTPDIYGNTLLHCLAVQKDLQTNYQDLFYRAPLQDILTALKIKNENNKTPITIAIHNQNVKFIDHLFECIKSVGTGKDELKKIIEACKEDIFNAFSSNKIKSPELITQFLELGVDFKSRGLLSFLEALQNKDKPFVRFLIKSKVDCEAKNERGESVLHIMSSNKFWDSHLITELIESGAAIEAIDHHKRTPLIVAAQCDNIVTIHALLKKNANINAVDASGCGALNYLIRKGHKETALEMLANMDEQVVKNVLSDSDQEIVSSWLKGNQWISARLQLKLIKTYSWMWRTNLDMMSKLSPEDQFSPEQISELIRTTDTNNNTLFHFVIRHDRVEWIKLLSIAQIFEMLKSKNNLNETPASYLIHNSRCFEYLLEKSEAYVELKAALFSEVEVFVKALKDGNVSLLRKFREYSPSLAFQEWICSTIKIDSQVFDNPILYALTFKKLECVKEMLYFYDKELGDIFTNLAYNEEFSEANKVLTIGSMGQVAINSCIETHMKRATFWIDKLKWLEARSLFGKHLTRLETPLPQNREEFVAALETNPNRTKRLLLRKIEYREYSEYKVSTAHGYSYQSNVVANPPSILDQALANNLIFVFQEIAKIDPRFLYEICRHLEFMHELMRNQRTDIIRYLSKSDLVYILQNLFEKRNYLTDIITTWPPDKVGEFFNLLQPTSTSSSAYRANLSKLFSSVDAKQFNLLHIAIQANNSYVLQFIKNFDAKLFRDLLIANKNSSEISPLRLAINSLNPDNPVTITILRILLEEHPAMVEAIIALAKLWAKEIRPSTMQLDRVQKIITNYLFNYVNEQIHESTDFPIHLLDFAETLKLDVDVIIKRIPIGKANDFLKNKNRMEGLYVKYSRIIQTLLNNRDHTGKNLFEQLISSSAIASSDILDIIDNLAALDLDFLNQLIRDQDKQKNTLLHRISNDEIIARLYLHAPDVVQGCLLVKNKNGHTSLEIAELSRDERWVYALLRIKVSCTLKNLKDLQQLANLSISEIVIANNKVDLLRQEAVFKSEILKVRQVIRTQQIELREKTLKMPFMLPTEEEILKYSEELSYRDKAIGCSKIPEADSKIDIGKLKTYFDQIYKKLPETAKINDDEVLRLKSDVKAKFDSYIDIFNSTSHEVGGKTLSSSSKALINNILRHLIASFMKQESAIDLARKEGKPESEIKLMEKAFESNLKSVLIDHLAVGFFHCIDRIASECEDLYFEQVVGNMVNLEGKTLNNRLYTALLIWRREIFKDIVADLKTAQGQVDPHNAATYRYYQKKLAGTFALGSSELSNAKENYEEYALGSPMNNAHDKVSREPKILENFNKQHSPQEIISKVKKMCDKSNPIPSQLIFQWFEQFYALRDEDRQSLLLADGTWNPAAIALFLVDPSIGVLKSS